MLSVLAHISIGNRNHSRHQKRFLQCGSHILGRFSNTFLMRSNCVVIFMVRKISNRPTKKLAPWLRRCKIIIPSGSKPLLVGRPYSSVNTNKYFQDYYGKTLNQFGAFSILNISYFPSRRLKNLSFPHDVSKLHIFN